jgi:tRNA A-37 threonylcarbamoyl transferase component Bud32
MPLTDPPADPAAGVDFLEQAVERFESAWRRGERPTIETFLPAISPLREPLLVELVHADLEFRLKAGEPARVEQYLQCYPELGARGILVALLSAEYEQRRRREAGLSLSEYRGRFPDHGDLLAARVRGSASGSDPTRADDTRPSRPDADRAGPATPPLENLVVSALVLEGRLRESRLLDRRHLEELERLHGRFAGIWDLVKHALRHQWLTAFQIQRLLQGRGAELVFGPYLLLDRLGQGGMGQVFKARHQLLGRVVALKLLPPDMLDDPQALRRFRREIQAVSRLSHPNIVRAVAADELAGCHFLVLEYVEGVNLARLVTQSGPLRVHEACDYIRQAALGLQHAHEYGLVHRDVKPGNLMLQTGTGLVKVLDLGLVRWLRAKEELGQVTTLTMEGAVIGTPDYMAPEQTVNAHAVDIRADVYSLGCTLYHLLTGRVPFPDRSVTQKLLKHQLAEPYPVEGLRPDLPPELAAVLRKLMAKKPEDRYQTPAEAAEALTPFATL